MPIYEYQCTNCAHSMEVLQKLNAEPLSVCPACQQPALRKLVSAASFRLKGSGWYETDFKKTGKKHLAGETDPSVSAKPESTEGKADSGKTPATAAGSSEAQKNSEGKTDAVKAPAVAKTGGGSVNPG